ncbi:MAG TPA: type II toxin-antitoxin system HicB family antitoxin [Ktedonobacterales bacterium]|nr:type II toxin-antitoxin system HicB family antitoxin [Ktedonobacterales bacterium]
MCERRHYSMLIEWSPEDGAYVVSFPEWENTGRYFAHTHGATYAEAVTNSESVLADLVALASERGDSLPEPSYR